MNISKELLGTKLTMILEGRVDTSSAPQLDEELSASLDGITELVLDLRAVGYLSSAGLRSILTAQKRMNRQGNLTVCNVCESIMEVFEMTGFVDILNIV